MTGAFGPAQKDQLATPVAFYGRVSGEEQAKRETILSQREFFTRWTELHDLPQAGIYEDDGVSGTVPFDQRPGGARLLADVQAGKVREVVVYRVDRIGRDARVILEALATLEEAGARVRSMTEPFDNITPAGRFLLGILAVVAGFERDSILERLRGGKRRRAALGEWQGGPPPFGYKVFGTRPGTRLALAEEEWIDQAGMSSPDLVKKIYTDLAGGATCLSIAQQLNDLGVPSPAVLRGQNRSGKWSVGTMSKMIRNPVFKGERVHGREGDGPEIQSECPALVSPELWQAAIDKLAGNRQLAKKNSTRLYLLRGLVKCSICGSNYIGRTHAGRDHLAQSTGNARGVTYSCRRRVECGQFGYERCEAPRISGELEGVVWQTLVQYLRDPATIERLLQRAATSDQATDQSAAERDRIEKLLRGKVAERDRVATMTRRGMLDFEAAERQLSEIAREEAALRAELAAVQKSADAKAATAGDIESARALVAKVAALLDVPGAIPWEVRRAVVERLVAKIVIEPIPGKTEQHGKYNAARALVFLKFGPPQIATSLQPPDDTDPPDSPPDAPGKTDPGGGLAGSYEGDKGQAHVKRALEVAAAGGHNVLLVGSPGSGKTMLARRMPTILPPLSVDEALEVTKLYSVSGMLPGGSALVCNRPFRAPHHTISNAGLTGGGSIPRPGEVSLSHLGVLFLDELPEFNRDVLEVMRQPLEDGHVTIARAAAALTYPARFTLVAAMNPCPCGFYGDPVKACTCSQSAVNKYLQKISGPLLDRIDLHIEVPRLKTEELSTPPNGESSAAIRERVLKARDRQLRRFAAETVTAEANQPTEKVGTAAPLKTFCNAHMTSRQLRTHCVMEPEAKALLSAAITTMHLSARAYDRILKVGRTIADLAGSDTIGVAHIAEAVQYRALDRKLWG